MAEADLDTLYFSELKKIRRIDCSTPRCYSNGFCTGYMRRHAVVGWGIEYECPDCKSKGLRSGSYVANLVEQILEADQEAQQKLVESYVASRPNTRNPFREPWP